MKKLWEKIKPFVEAVKAARMALALWVMIIGYMGYNESNRPLAEPVIEPEIVEENTIVQKMHIAKPVKQINCMSIIKREAAKQNRAHEYEYHGGK